MTWQRIESRHLRTAEPDGSSLLYLDPGPLESGSLLLWLAPDGQVRGFQLRHAPFPGGREHLADWQEGRPLRLAEVDSGEPGANQSRRIKMSPIVRRASESPSALASRLLDYFERNAAVLEPQQRTLIRSLLSAGSTPGSC